MDDDLQQRVTDLEVLVERLIAHLAEDGALSHETYDLMHDRFVTDRMRHPQIPPQ